MEQTTGEIHGVPVDKLAADIIRFIGAHLNELDASEVFALGNAAGIVARVHADHANNGANNGVNNGG